VDTRALVLGGGGVTGVAWELGVLAGLHAGGLDLTGADLLVGTSAGSVVAAQVASGMSIEDLYQRQLAGPGNELPARMSPLLVARWGWAMLRARDAAAGRARIGRLALDADTVPEADRRAVIASRLPTHEWPEQRLLITAIDAHTGELRVFDRDSGVALTDAVAASCAVPGVWPPVTVDGHRYVDGGIRSGTNLDLAAGCDRIVVIAPTAAGGGPIPSVAKQVAALGPGVRTVVVTPDRDARRAIGRNVLDPARRAGSARAGRAQASSVAAAVAAVWNLAGP
jgi:NTE family protein